MTTLPRLLERNARRSPGRTALREKELGIWRSLSWREVREQTKELALGFRTLGLERGGTVAILGDNRPEWLIAELAAQALGAVSMGVYQDSVAEEVRYLVHWSDATIVVAEDQEQVDKLLEQRDELPRVRAIVYYDPRGLRSYDHELLRSFEGVRKLGRETANAESEYAAAVEATDADDIALFSTTSGTTGKPKLAMLSHRNLLAMAGHLQAVDPLGPSDEFLSFLPLAWIGEQMVSAARALSEGFAVSFPEEPETVQRDLCEIGPHVLFAPPRIWENWLSEMQVRHQDAAPLKRWVYRRALAIGYAAADRARSGHSPNLPQRLAHALADWCCLLWIRDQLGLRRLRHAYTGGAALGPDVFRFFHAIGVELKQIYGQTEVSGISVVHRDGDIRYHTVGRALPATELRIGDNGEILTRSDAVFRGYYKNEEATEETLRDGWLHSGDAGYFERADGSTTDDPEEDAHLVVIDRAKDVRTLPDGTRFSPQFVENKLKFSPYVSEAVVFSGELAGGDAKEARTVVAAFIDIDFANTGKWAERRALPYTTFTDLAQKDEVVELVREHVAAINPELPAAARVRRFLLLHKQLDADDEELTRTRKVRRGFIADRYQTLVDALFGEEERVTVESEVTYQDGTRATIRPRLRVARVE